jgi:hypothetical protein
MNTSSFGGVPVVAHLEGVGAKTWQHGLRSVRFISFSATQSRKLWITAYQVWSQESRRWIRLGREVVSPTQRSVRSIHYLMMYTTASSI